MQQIKIDRSFVQGLGRDDNDAAIVRATIELGHNLGLQVTAEGVEDHATFEVLADLGCDAAQGYYVARPSVASNVPPWFEEAPAVDLSLDGLPLPLAPLVLPDRGAAAPHAA